MTPTAVYCSSSTLCSAYTHSGQTTECRRHKVLYSVGLPDSPIPLCSSPTFILSQPDYGQSSVFPSS